MESTGQPPKENLPPPKRSQKRMLVAGPPQSGKTHRLIGIYLDSLRAQPFARRLFLAPNTSHRDHLRVQVMQQGCLEALPEGEIITFSEFLYNLGMNSGLVKGRRMTTLEELVQILHRLHGVNEGLSAPFRPIPETLASAAHVIAGLDALRRSGLYVQDAPGLEIPEDLGCELMDMFAHFRLDVCRRFNLYDSLMPQEIAVRALQDDNPALCPLLPELALIDGFWDFHPLHKLALKALAQHGADIYLNAPEVPGDAALAKLSALADEMGFEREELPPRNKNLDKLLTALAQAREGKECAKELVGAITALGMDLRPCTTHQREAEFIGDTVLKLHRRKGFPLDEFLIILNSPDARFISALTREFAARGLPLIDLLRGGKPALMPQFLSACFAYAAKQDALSLEALLLAACPYVLRWNHSLFAHITRMGAFLDEQSLAPILASPEQQKFAALLEQLAGLRREMKAEELITHALGAAEAWGNLMLAQMREACADEGEIALEEAALKAACEALTAPDDMQMPADKLLAAAAEACRCIRVSLPERSVGGVYLVDGLVARQWQKRVVFIPQCTADAWPRPYREVNVGGEKLRKAMNSAGLEVRTPEDSYAFEQSLFLSALSRASEAAYVTYPQRQFDGKPLLQSPFLYALEDALRKLGGTKPEDGAPSFADERALVLEAASELRWGDCIDTGIEGKAASAVYAKCDAEKRDQILHVGGIATEDMGTPLEQVSIPDKFSPAALTAFRKCPYLYFASQLLVLGEEMDTLEEGLGPKEVGIAVHSALNDAFARKLSPEALLGVFGRKLKDIAHARGYLGKFELELQRELIVWRAALREFYETELRLMKESKAEVAEMERDLALDIQDANGVPFSLHGFIDRADKDGDGHKIYDYKSGRSDRYAAGEGLDIAQGLSLAWLIYPLIAQEAFKAASAPPFSLLFVRDNEEKLVLAEMPAILQESMLRSVAVIRTKNFPRAPHSVAVSDCAECDMCRICRRDVFTEEVPNAVQEEFPEGPPCIIGKGEERE